MGIANIRPGHRDHHSDGGGVARDDYDTLTSNNQQCKLRDIGGIADTSPWVVDYYGQVLGADDAVHHSDVNLSPVYQQYCKVSGYTLRMSDPLPDAKAVIVSGGVVPNVGDVVISKNDRPWLFLRVVEVEVGLPRENPNYVVSIEEFGYTDENDVNYLDLETKSSCRKVEGANGGLTSAEAIEADRRLMKYYCTVADNYFRTFVDSDTDLLMYKAGDVQLYDHHLAKLCQRTVESRFWRYKYGYRLVHVHEEKPFNTVFSVLLDVDIPMLLSRVRSEVSIIGRKSSRSNVSVANFLHTPATHIAETEDVIGLDSVVGVELSAVVLDAPKVYPDIDGSPDIISVLSDASYVLSEGYYANSDTGLSLLEKMVLQYKQERVVEKEHVERLYMGYADWDDIDRFYLTPILLMFTLIAVGEV